MPNVVSLLPKKEDFKDKILPSEKQNTSTLKLENIIQCSINFKSKIVKSQIMC